MVHYTLYDPHEKDYLKRQERIHLLTGTLHSPCSGFVLKLQKRNLGREDAVKIQEKLQSEVSIRRVKVEDIEKLLDEIIDEYACSKEAGD